MKTLRSALLLLLILPAFAQDRTEQKLSDAMVKAMREAVRREMISRPTVLEKGWSLFKRRVSLPVE